ncbi:Alpha/Beta hydrolase fold, partial [Lactarius tabidus]
ALLVPVLVATATVFASPSTDSTCPAVKLDRGIFIGTPANGTSRFLGIPFAHPPVGNLRFRRPEPLGPYTGKHNATEFGLSCPQQAMTIPSELQGILPTSTGAGVTIVDGEDCLNLNVITPANVKPGSKLPVVVVGILSMDYDGTVIVNRSITLQQPVIYVSMNYRLSAFGFLASQEVKDAGVGNLGLWDQRLALHWIQKYIHAFGGDPSKVTIWGESAGSMSVSLQMVTNGGDTEGLFRAAFMESGSPIPTSDITAGQPYYDFLVESTGCSGSSDTLACLRAAPYDELKAAMDSTPSVFSYQSVAIAWLPRVDGIFLVDDPQELLQRGEVARIPFVSGDCDDEGTLFSLSQTNVTTEAELRTYLKEFVFPDATDAQMDELLTLYPQNPTLGSPYDSGTQNELTPQFKRIASILGDFIFQGPRRFFLENVSDKQNVWSFLSKRLKSVPILGAFHSSDLPNVYGGGDLTDFLIQFVTNLDPNGILNPHWPRYTTSSPHLMTLLGSQLEVTNNNRTITLDTFRIEGIEFITNLSLIYAGFAHPSPGGHGLLPSTAYSTCPIVTLDRGTFIGTAANGTNRFLGIPFAHPPVGDLRFRRPEPLGPYTGKHNATAFGLSCPQQTSTTPPTVNDLPQGTLDALLAIPGTGVTIVDGEDCLNLNVITPANVKPVSKLPVVVWIYGGETGATPPTQICSDDGTVIVNRSITLQQPVIYVSMNYRISAFGFLASQEVKDARVGNLGLWDQRLALHWVQTYIHAFGGDPSKVTIWGESAGSISVSLQMVTNGGDAEGLFRAAFMESGSPLPTSDITAGQPYYDFLVESTGCSGSSDTLSCLRAAPYNELKAAMDSTPIYTSYQSVALVWLPRVDGVFLVDDPQELLQRGEVARIPFVSGDCDDEGTSFSLYQNNVTTEAELRTYLKEFVFPNATDAEMDKLLTLYPQNVTQGSPYDTGTQNALTPQFKRIASILGDYEFQAPRRFFLQTVSDKQNVWSFLSKRLKSVPIIGSFHTSDLPNVYGGGDLTDFLIQFVTNLDPNGILSPYWPRYTTSSPQLMTLLDSQLEATNNNRTVTLDKFRVEGIEFITNLSLTYST